MMGMEKAPNTIEEAVTKTMAAVSFFQCSVTGGIAPTTILTITKIDSSTREKTSGKFLNVIDGTEFPW